MEGGIRRENDDGLMFYPAVSTFIHSTEIKRHLLYRPLKPFRAPIYCIFTPLTSQERKHSSERLERTRKGLRPLSVSLSSPLLLMKHLELSELHNGTTFNQNHKQSREELCLSMNTVQVNAD